MEVNYDAQDQIGNSWGRARDGQGATCCWRDGKPALRNPKDLVLVAPARPESGRRA